VIWPRADEKNSEGIPRQVSLLGGPVTEKSARSSPVVLRTIEIRGGRTPEPLQEATFHASGRYGQHRYEFEIRGSRPMGPKAKRYVLPVAVAYPFDDDRPDGLVIGTIIGSLGLRVTQVLQDWFDSVDGWWHRIKVAAILKGAPPGQCPRLTKKIGEAPPQHMDWDQEGEELGQQGPGLMQTRDP
jgi:hypothetical protein